MKLLKTILTITIVIILVFSLAACSNAQTVETETETESAPAFVYGDADNDGVVSISDVTLIQRILAELEQDDDGMIELRVTNGEEKLNIFNATEIQRYLARLPIERTIDIPIIKSLA